MSPPGRNVLPPSHLVPGAKLLLRASLLGFVTYLAAPQAALAKREKFDVLIRGGTVYDGTGAPGLRADVGIRGDAIAAVRDLPKARAKTVIDATGLAVAPGFIN